MNEDITQIRRRAVMSRALLRTTSRLGLSRERLASATGLRLAEIASLENEAGELDPADPRWNAFVELVRLCWILDVVSAGDDAAMRDWMHCYNRDLNAVPADFIAGERGLSEAIRYLEAH
ncbi:MAG: hypothetical protein WD081_06665 [Gammaproteobacteria bacterium]